MAETWLTDTAELTRGAFGDDARVADRLLPQLYEQLRSLARSKLRSERADHTLDTSALVHEAYMKMSGETRIEWKSRSHFLALAAVAMRRILIDYAKSRNAEKRGGADVVHVTLDGSSVPDGGGGLEPVDLLQLENSLTRLAGFNPRGAAVVQYRFFAGLTNEEIAEVLGVSVPTVRRSWAVARAWLASEMG
jgi:RNA polymerase sigma factor (TIGR02999 family)